MNKEYIITSQRKVFNTEGDRSTIGEVFTDGSFFCYSLEDECRFDGQKTFGETAIPAIRYNVAVTMSPKFKRKTILLYNQPDYSIQYKGIKFTGVRVHRGLTAKHSHGCPLVGYKTDGVKIWDSAESELTKLAEQKIKEGYKVYWDVQIKPFRTSLNNVMA